MQISKISIRNFRRLEDVSTTLEDSDTVFVGPNNSGKTSATAVFRCFWDQTKFTVHDFSVSRTKDFEDFLTDPDSNEVPAIELDIWLSIDPEEIEFGRVFSLLPNLTNEFTEVGIRLRYSVKDKTKLLGAYLLAYPAAEPDDVSQKTLLEFLGSDRNLNNFFEVSYSSLEVTDTGVEESLLDPKEGNRLIREWVRVDFVDAQRNIGDDESQRSNKLSSAFAAFYRKNLDEPKAMADAHKVIDDNNERLTDHYGSQFEPLMTLIKGLGIPSVNDRDLKIVSSMSPEAALKGSTDLIYIDAAKKHELPERYNGLGFKNLIYMAIQAKQFHEEWVSTNQNRPLCQIIFIEEPEVHLHAQVQQTFIKNIWSVLKASAVENEEPDLVPQLVVTTHSSHVLDAIDFVKVRHFQRCHLSGEKPEDVRVKSASVIKSLRDFQPEIVDVDGQNATPKEALDFLVRYIKLTHCDLFFADAVVLVEGSVEKILLPQMINQSAPKLDNSFLSILEVGGAYAHRFEGLLKFLNLPYLVITDLDSVSHAGNHKSCRADEPDALTSNATLKSFFGTSEIKALSALASADKIDKDKIRCTSYQTITTVEYGEQTKQMAARTLEEAFVYDNYQIFKDGNLSIGVDFPEILDNAYTSIFERIKSSNFKKTDFAMHVLANPVEWVTPTYISEGLQWLEGVLSYEIEEA